MTLEQLLAKYDPALRAAFIAGISEIRAQARLAEVIAALERGDIQAAVDVLYIEREAYREFEAALSDAFTDGGVNTLQELSPIRDANGNRFVIRFNARDNAAEQILRLHSSTLITQIVADQREAVRQALTEGMARGDNPRKVGLDIVGRVDPATQRRTGGLLGLSAAQERYVSNASQELATGDYAAYLTRERRDKRFDRMVMKAMRDGKPLSQADITRITGRYSARLLALRGEVIGRTEALRALHEGQYAALQQAIATGRVDARDVRLVWKATFDGRTRDTHAALHGETIGWGETFQTFRGNRLRYPGDTMAPASETINCRCTMVARIDYGANLRRSGG